MEVNKTPNSKILNIIIQGKPIAKIGIGFSKIERNLKKLTTLITGGFREKPSKVF